VVAVFFMNSSASARTLVVTDADNTLWDTNKGYEDAQLGLLEGVERFVNIHADVADRLEYIRELDRAIVSKLGGRWAYAAHILSNALHQRLSGQSIERSVEQAVESSHALHDPGIPSSFELRLRTSIPQLRQGVRRGLEELRALGATVVVATEGKPQKTHSLLSGHELAPFVSEVVVVEDKAAKPWIAQLERLRADFSVAVAVGDQISRDIVPARLAGFRTVLFPSRYRSHSESPESPSSPDVTIASFEEVPRYVRAITGDATRTTERAARDRGR